MALTKLWETQHKINSYLEDKNKHWYLQFKLQNKKASFCAQLFVMFSAEAHHTGVAIPGTYTLVSLKSYTTLHTLEYNYKPQGSIRSRFRVSAVALTGDKIYWLIFTSTFENRKACCGGGKNKRSLGCWNCDVLSTAWVCVLLILLPRWIAKWMVNYYHLKQKAPGPSCYLYLRLFVLLLCGGAHQMRGGSSSTHLTRA